MTAPHLTGVGSGRGDWRTPPELFAKLNRLYALNFDAFASHDNHLTGDYCTDDGQYCACSPGPWPRRPGELIAPTDGLATSWAGRRVFGNPPYSRGFLHQAVDKAIVERDAADVIVLLLPSATEAQWFRDLERHGVVQHLPQRVRFIHPFGECSDTCQTRKVPHVFGAPGDSPPSGHCVAVLRPSWMDR